MWRYRIARPLLIFIGLETLLLLLVFGLPYLVSERAWVTDALVQPLYRRPDLADLVTTELIANLTAAGLKAWVLGAVLALVWLATTALHHPIGPGQAGRRIGICLGLLGLALILTELVFYQMVFLDGLFLVMLPDKLNLLATCLGLLCLLAYHPFGIFAATPPLHRPAVPFAYLLTRG
jgi:hypothetical protein